MSIKPYVQYGVGVQKQFGERLTGYAQIHGRNGLTWEKKFEWDVKYTEEITFLNDWKIIMATIKAVLTREGINAAGEATMPIFTGK